jgi:hypothetical protein
MTPAQLDQHLADCEAAAPARAIGDRRMNSFAHQLAPAKKSPTSTVNPQGRGNGQPGGQLDVGADLSDAELIRHVQDCGWRDVYPKDRLARPC